MPTYAYAAVDGTGRRLQGRTESDSALSLRDQLRDQGLLLVESEPEHSAQTLVVRWRLGTRRAVLEVTRALASLLPSGMPLARALITCQNLAAGGVRDALTTVQLRVERGESLASALAQHPHCFSAVYIGLVRAGERSGDLAGAFRRLAEQLEREAELRDRLVSASIYPALLLAAGGTAILLLFAFVLPRFVELIQGSGAPLPGDQRLYCSPSPPGFAGPGLSRSAGR